MKLVLLPGLDGTGELFEPFCRALGDSVSAAVQSYPVDPALAYAELVNLVRKALPGDEPFVLLAESFSGPIAIELAAEQPSGLRGLILCCSFASSPRPGLAGLHGLLAHVPFARLPSAPMLRLLLGTKVPAAMRAWVRGVVERLPSALVAARLQAVLRVDVRAALERIRVPTLYLQAAQDHLVPSRSGEEIRRRCGVSTLESLPGPHGLLQVEAQAAAKAVLAFTAQLNPAWP